MKRRFCLSFSLLCLLIRSLKIVIVEKRAYGIPNRGKSQGKNVHKWLTFFPDYILTRFYLTRPEFSSFLKLDKELSPIFKKLFLTV